MKKCTKCCIEKSLEDFPKHTMTKDKRTSHCRECEKKRRLEVRYKITVDFNICRKCGCTKSKENFAKNPRRIGGLHHWCKQCSKKLKIERNYNQQQNIRRKQRILVDEEYKLYLREQKRLNSKINFTSTMLNNAKRRAKLKGYNFNLVKEDLVIPEYCPILKIPIILGTKNDYENSPSIDRIDNSKGYTKDNIQIISKKANSMKNSATFTELKLFADWILQNIN